MIDAACRRLDDDLAAWRAGALPAAAGREHELHLAGCAACQRLLAGDEALDAALDAVAPSPAHDDALALAIERLGAAPPTGRDRRVPWPWVIGLALGAACAVAADLAPRAPRPSPPRRPWRYQAAPLTPADRPHETQADPRAVPGNV